MTARQSQAVGVSSRELCRWVKSGRLEHAGRGVYRVSNFPASRIDHFAAAVEVVGEDSYLYGESVIGMLRLAATNPTWIHVATPRRVRKRLSDGIKIHRVSAGYQPFYYEGVRAQRAADAILSCRGVVVNDRLREALDNGVECGYIGRDEARFLRKEIGK